MLIAASLDLFCHGRTLASTRQAISLLAACFMLCSANMAQAQGQLDYRQRQTFKLADDNLFQVEANLEQVSKEVGAATAKDSAAAQSGINALRKYLKYANDQLAKLPADHADVKALAKRAADGAAAVEKLQAALDVRVRDTTGAMRGEASQLAADVDKLTEWGRSFSDAPNLFHKRPDDALMLVSNVANVEAEWKAIQARWPALLDGKNHESDARTLQAAAQFFDRSFPAFKSHVAKLRQELPGETDELFTRAQSLLDQAVAKKNPLLITNGVSGEMSRIEGNVRLMTGIDPVAGRPYQQRMEAMRQTARQAGQALRESILQSNPLPQDQYAGDDVAALRDRVRAKWKELHPDTEVLAVVFNTPGWNRVTRWQCRLHRGATGDLTGGTWEKVDYDHIQPKLIIRQDDRLALVLPVDVYKDHLKGEQLAISPWERPAEPDVQSLILLDRVRKPGS